MKKHYFNMIEVAIALGVAAIAIVSIMALFPVGFTTARNAMAETYAAEVADEFLHQIEAEIRSGGGWNFTIIETSRPAPPTGEDFEITTFAPYTSIYEDPANPGRYKAIRFVDTQNDQIYNPDEDILDFEAIIEINRSQVDFPDGGSGTTLDYAVAVRLEMEISWPARRPYDRRETRQYVYEIFNRN